MKVSLKMKKMGKASSDNNYRTFGNENSSQEITLKNIVNIENFPSVAWFVI